MRVTLSDVAPRFQKQLKRNGNKCCLIKFLSFCFCNYLVESQLFLQWFLREFGSQKKMVEKH